MSTTYELNKLLDHLEQRCDAPTVIIRRRPNHTWRAHAYIGTTYDGRNHTGGQRWFGAGDTPAQAIEALHTALERKAPR